MLLPGPHVWTVITSLQMSFCSHTHTHAHTLRYKSMWSRSPPSDQFAVESSSGFIMEYVVCCMLPRFPTAVVFPVCSSAPVGMKIQPLNQTALIVSWERPLTVYHPPITSYMVSYSWSKSDVADEKTFSKIGDQRTVSAVSCLRRRCDFYRRLQCLRHLRHSHRVVMGSVRR